ncbi:MAG: phosphoribosylamine--glycine ligase [Thermonemataceae bacterium]
MNILILGSGGREHAFAWKIKQSTSCERLYVAPGNAGTAQIAENVSILLDDFTAIAQLCIEKKIDLVVVGPEAPLVNGIIDFFQQQPALQAVQIIGTSQAGAQQEGSKDFAKRFMQEQAIPTAQYATFTVAQYDAAIAYVEKHPLPIVLKADGLAAGKGVIICDTHTEAKEILKEMLLEEKFGVASQKVVIEQFLSGIELSVFILTDGKHYKILPSAKDYKRIGEGDTGLNTGGMGAISPVSFADAAFMQKVEAKIVQPTLKGLQAAQINYKGFLFIGLMKVGDEPYVIEYNVRMGDPETQVVLPRIQTDLVTLLQATAQQTLDKTPLTVEEQTATTVVLVSGGYPEAYEKGKVIEGLAQVKESIVFHAGTAYHNEKLVTNGGRVLAITSLGKSMDEALQASRKVAEQIQFEGKYYRKDIGADLQEV